MKYLGVLFLTASLCLAADFNTGQAARYVIGQRTFTAQQSGASEVLVGGVSGLAYANDTLFVTDSNVVGAGPVNHRALIFSNVSSFLPATTDELPQEGLCSVCGGTAKVVVGQPDFTETAYRTPPDPASMRKPAAVASDGLRLVIADTENNRVLIWNTIPTTNNAPADVVVGQPDFTTSVVTRPPTSSSLLGPQGVWIQGNRLFVADTYNHRVLIWNAIPTSNGQAADVVLGRPDFVTTLSPDLVASPVDPQANTLLSPVSVTADSWGRLYVADTGHNRVLIWNSIPTTNQTPADVVIGQPDMSSAIGNNTAGLNEPIGQDDEGKDIYPYLSAAVVDFPRYVLSDGERLFVADSGNDRVLIFNQVPILNGQSADVVLGQMNGDENLNSDGRAPLRRASPDSMRTPMSLAWDGTNLYVSDSFNRRVLVFSEGETSIPLDGVRNAASLGVSAVGEIVFEGQAKEDDEISITFGLEGQDYETEYSYTIGSGETLESVVNQLCALINEGDGDPLVLATPNPTLFTIILTARLPGEKGDEVERVVRFSNGAAISVTLGTDTLSGGGDAAKVGPGTLVSIFGTDLAEVIETAPPDADSLPTEMGGVQVYLNGILAPLLYVSPTQINAQIPFEAASVALFATVGISLSGEARTGDELTFRFGKDGLGGDTEYTYRVGTEDDTLAKIATGVATLINEGDGDPWVIATGGGSLPVVILSAREAGIGGEDIFIRGELSANASIKFDTSSEYLLREATDSTALSAYVRVARTDGRVTVTTPVGVPVVPQNPGVFTFYGPDPRTGIALHYSSYAMGVVSVDGVPVVGDEATVTINGRTYSYVVKEVVDENSDEEQPEDLKTIRDELIKLINAGDPQVVASPSGIFARILLRAKVPGPMGNGTKISGNSDTGSSSSLVITPTTATLGGANIAGSLVTETNPARNGEVIVVYATGLGRIIPQDGVEPPVTGEKYKGPVLNEPVEFVSSLAGGRTGHILSAGLKPGTVGIYEVLLQLAENVETNPSAQLTIAQDVYVSNVVIIPVLNIN